MLIKVYNIFLNKQNLDNPDDLNLKILNDVIKDKDKEVSDLDDLPSEQTRDIFKSMSEEKFNEQFFLKLIEECKSSIIDGVKNYFVKGDHADIKEEDNNSEN